MTTILNTAEMRARDAATIAAGTSARTLVERAASAALEILFAEFDTTLPLFLCGGGNNGADGLAMARFFTEKAGAARVCYLGALDEDGDPDRSKMTAEAAEQLALLPEKAVLYTDLDLQGVSVVVDAVIGVGLTRPVEGQLAEAISSVNRSQIPVLAIDLPTGVCADTGRVMGIAMRAVHTVSMAAYKYGHWLYPGTTLCGRVTVANIGISTENAKGALLDRCDLATLPTRPERGHKGTFGRVLVIGGSVGMSGAGFLAAKAAYRAGAGLVEIFAPSENRVIYQTQLPEALLTLYDPNDLDEKALLDAIARADAVAIGMGLGRSALCATLCATVLTHAAVPVVIDADALNEIAADPHLMQLLQQRDAVSCLTPHLGEMSRLCGRPIAEIAQDLPGAAANAAALFGVTTVLKDARTVIAEGDALYLNRFGNCGMATGGSGDVLAGIIAAFYAAGDEKAPLHGVLVHALAGDAARERCGLHGLMASDLIDALRHVLP